MSTFLISIGVLVALIVLFICSSFLLYIFVAIGTMARLRTLAFFKASGMPLRKGAPPAPIVKTHLKPPADSFFGDN